jgi:endonuclease I
VAFGATCNFNYVNVGIPAGYYDSALGLRGSALRVALHNIIKNHAAQSYSYALTAFQTTDVKPNGKVWDMYSDVPDGTPPYEYSFGQTGQGATEGLGYNREHSWPQSWFGGGSPMYSDLWILYPTDAKVNGYRANYPYGEVGTASTTSLNGSRLGSSASVGYGGTVFEPIDAYKGDLARGQFYVATRYFNQDAGWPGSASAAGAELLPWAVQQYSQWAAGDPVSWKERLRNGAVYVIQNNRNPFVDHPEFVAMIYDSNTVVGVDEGAPSLSFRLHQNLPNPFGTRTVIGFDLARREQVRLRVYDVSGRLVRTLVNGRTLESGRHHVEWNGRDDRDALVESGLYFCRLDAGPASVTRRMAFVR